MEKHAHLRVRLTPRGGKNAVIGIDERGVLLARVSAAPVDGAANRALIELLSAVLEIPKSRISFRSGETAREKTLIVDGVDDVDLSLRLKAALDSAPAGGGKRSKSSKL